MEKTTNSDSILFIVNCPDFFMSHRLPLALAARASGISVHIATGPGPACKEIANLRFRHYLLPLSRSGYNPFIELRALLEIYQLMRRIRPDLVHLVTIKAVIYGGLAARFLSIPAMVAAISGLGTMFIDSGLKNSISRQGIQWLYRVALNHSNVKVIFQNLDDRDSMIKIGAVRSQQTTLIRGSGVSLVKYSMRPEPQEIPVVTFAARLLKDKGVREFVEAAKILKIRGTTARFWLAGSLDPGNLTSITENELSLWSTEGVIEVLGFQSNIPTLFAKSNIVVLPSYREGLPRVLIEAAACGRAVVTTDVPGCREAIEPDKTGLLVPVKDAKALADAIQILIEDAKKRGQMGVGGRALAEREFSIEKVIEAHLAIYSELLSKRVVQ